MAHFAASDMLPPSYPRQYPNNEGFTFACSGPTHHQFPLVANGGHFDGSTSPGPDSVVYEYVIFFFCENLTPDIFFSDSGNFCGCITQTGAPGNGFLQCSN